MADVWLWLSIPAQAASAALLAVLPAWLLVRRLRLDPLTTLSVAVVASLALAFALQLATYLVGLPAPTPGWVLVALSVVAAVRMWRGPEGPTAFPRAGFLTWLGVIVWTLGIQGQIVVYGGLGTYGDWFEHYERSLFFLEQQPPATRFLGHYAWSLAARAPLFNAVAANHLGLFGHSFVAYQVVATVLNTTLVVPFALLCRDLAGLRERAALLLSGIVFALAPVAVQQQTFTWTKFCAFACVMTGLHVYVRALRASSARTAVVAFLVLAVAILAHYVAIVFAGLCALHFIVSGRRLAGGWRTVLGTGAACAAVLLPWFAYLAHHLGWNEITATVGEEYAQPRTGEASRGEVVLSNLVSTVVPAGWRHDWPGVFGAPPAWQFDPRGSAAPPPHSSWLAWRDDLLTRSRSLLGMLGWAGLLALLSLPLVGRRVAGAVPARPPPPGRWFWGVLFAVGLPLQIAVTPYFARLGLGRLLLPPYFLLILVLVVRRLAAAPRWWVRCVSTLAVLESLLCLWCFLQFHARTLPLSPWPGRPGKFLIDGPLPVDRTYTDNYLLRLENGVEMLSEALGSSRIWFGIVAASVGALLIWRAYLSRSRFEPGSSAPT